MKLSSTPTSPAEESQILPNNETKATEALKNGSSTELLKRKAYLFYRKGDKKQGEFYLNWAIEEAKHEKQELSFEEIDMIMSGNTSEYKKMAPPIQENNSPEGKKEKPNLLGFTHRLKKIRQHLQKILTPVQVEFEKAVNDLVKEVRKNLDIDRLMFELERI